MHLMCSAAPAIPMNKDLQGDSFVDWPNWADMQGIPHDAPGGTGLFGVDGFQHPGHHPGCLRHLYGSRRQHPSMSPQIWQPSAKCCPTTTNGCRGSFADFEYYTCRVDVTEHLVDHVDIQGKPLNGLWQYGHQTVGTENQYIMTTGVLGAWGMVVVYQSPLHCP